MSELATKGDVEKARQAARDLIEIRDGVLAGKIENLALSVGAKLQSFENSFCSLQKTLNKLMLTFLQGQEERHKELFALNCVVQEHTKKLNCLESRSVIFRR